MNRASPLTSSSFKGYSLLSVTTSQRSENVRDALEDGLARAIDQLEKLQSLRKQYRFFYSEILLRPLMRPCGTAVKHRGHPLP